jgi:hypothetical protein
LAPYKHGAVNNQQAVAQPSNMLAGSQAKAWSTSTANKPIRRHFPPSQTEDIPLYETKKTLNSS